MTLYNPGMSRVSNLVFETGDLLVLPKNKVLIFILGVTVHEYTYHLYEEDMFLLCLGATSKRITTYWVGLNKIETTLTSYHGQNVWTGWADLKRFPSK